jgi:hypothetical protein
MCSYTGRHFGASYEDGCCIDGYLWDLDSGDEDGLTSGGDIACPSCNTAAYLDDAKEEADSTCWGSSQGVRYCGAMIIEGALRTAERENPQAARGWIAENPQVASWDWPDRAAVLEGRASPDAIAEVVLVLKPASEEPAS